VRITAIVVRRRSFALGLDNQAIARLRRFAGSLGPGMSPLAPAGATTSTGTMVRRWTPWRGWRRRRHGGAIALPTTPSETVPFLP